MQHPPALFSVWESFKTSAKASAFQADGLILYENTLKLKFTLCFCSRVNAAKENVIQDSKIHGEVERYFQVVGFNSDL